MIDRKEKRLQDFAAFLSNFVCNLNQMSSEGWVLLVEGKRDEAALRGLGYEGALITLATLSRGICPALRGSNKVVILTDLDREGGVLAARSVKSLSRNGINTSLAERRRLKAASHGAFLHIENLSRFAESAALRPKGALLAEEGLELKSRDRTSS
jgi:5S rRNA maturation endonuclease (ribonuclease M5)